MKKLSLSIFLISFVILADAVAQEYAEGEPSFLDKVFVGGGFGAGFGDYTFVNISPIIGYRVSPRFSVAMRLMYQYTTFDYFDRADQEYKKYNGNDFGIGAFARYMLFGPVYLQAEYEHLNYDALYTNGDTSRDSFDSFMAGGGIAQPVGRKAFLFLTAMYNFSYENFNTTNVYRSPYDSPWVIRVGVTAGF